MSQQNLQSFDDEVNKLQLHTIQHIHHQDFPLPMGRSPANVNGIAIETTLEGKEKETIIRAGTTASVGTKQPKESFWQTMLQNDVTDDSQAFSKAISWSQLWKFAEPRDVALTVLGGVMAMCLGCMLPISMLFFGDLIGIWISWTPLSDQTFYNSELVRGVTSLCIVGAFTFVFAFIMTWALITAGENQAKRLRELYFASVMRQERGWFDERMTGEVSSRIVADVDVVQGALSEKLGTVIAQSVTFLVSLILAFVRSWELSLMLLIVLPLVAVTGALAAKYLSKTTIESLGQYGDAGACASQAVGSWRTVQAFGMEQMEMTRYDKLLQKAADFGKRAGMINGVSNGAMWLSMFVLYAVSLGWGAALVNMGRLSGGNFVTVFFALTIGSWSLGMIAPAFTVVSTGRGAAYTVYETISRQSKIDSIDPNGIKPNNVVGDIEFQNVTMRYPTRPDAIALDNFSLKISRGQTVALVGLSGSGKSSIIKMLLRFYDPEEGKIYLDGQDLSTINLAWLRQNLGLVEQEPRLFDMTIRQNVEMGLVNPEAFDETTLTRMVEDACRVANIHDFITKLPDGYNTQVGARSASMISGGQKQRIAIARAIISNPRILLLDEATSALDTTSERQVQAALDSAGADRTTIVISHRLSTITNADLIVAMKDGHIVEAGTHEQLLQKNSLYADLVRGQTLVEQEKSSTLPDQTQAEIHDEDVTVAIQLADLKRKGSERRVHHEEVEIETEPTPFWSTTKRILQNQWADSGYLMLGLIGAIGVGVSTPFLDLIFSVLTSLFSSPGEVLQQGALKYSLILVALGILEFCFNFMQYFGLTVAGEQLTYRLRRDCFNAVLRQDGSFFDLPENTTGAITGRLAEEAGRVKTFTTQFLGAFTYALAYLITAMVLSLTNSWQLTLVMLAVVPLVLFAGYVEVAAMSGYASTLSKQYDTANSIVAQAVSSHATVIALTKEPYFMQEYVEALEKPHQFALKGAYRQAFAYAFSQSITFFSFAIAFIYGGKLIQWQTVTAEQSMVVVFVLMLGMLNIGSALATVPSLGKAVNAAYSIFKTIDEHPKVDPNPQGFKADRLRVQGFVEGKELQFAYPTRPRVPILRGLTFEANPGQSIAFVGPSGCGKSTVIALLERYYDALGGNLCVEERDVKEWSVQGLRETLAIVSQEPVLFNGTIAQNIARGKPGGEALQSEIEEAAKKANIHDFIVEHLAQGYLTQVGEEGGLMSGGQKQRIAIARALIRDPKMLLLDEATSALDTQAEVQVQIALDAASKDRTTIIIAHRLSTIQRCDVIYVIERGQVVEKGNHHDLLQLNGKYAELVRQQSLSASGH